MRRLLAALVAVLLVVLAVGAVTTPSTAGPVPVRFTAAGDYGSSANAAATFARVASLDPDLHLALGDLSYGTTGQEQAWCDFVTSRVGAGFPVELLSGNHESDAQNGAINDFSACLPNQLPGATGTYGRQYYVDVPAGSPTVRFVMISPGLRFPDGTWSYDAGTPRYQWTAAAIDGARASGIPWVVVGTHLPCLSMGQYGCTSGSAIADLLVAKRVDLVLHGHEHLYQRTKQIAFSAECSALQPGAYDPACVADADDDFVAGAGTVVATVGTGGTPLRDVATADPERGWFAAWSGRNADPTFGLLDVTADADALTARFQRSAGGTFTDRFVLRKPADPSNAPPSASFTARADALQLSVDATASADVDGAITTYSWDFGDGARASGRTATHTFTTAGSYPVRLTVTDDDGATSSVSRVVEVTRPDSADLLTADDFDRAVTNGWGSAEVGGGWSASSTSGLSVTGGRGRVAIGAPGAGASTWLTAGAADSTDLQLVVSSDRLVDGGGLSVSARPRRVAGAGDYRAKVRLSGATVRLSLVRASSAGEETTIRAESTVSGVTLAAGDLLRVRTQAVGRSPTTLRAKVWREGSAEPGWQASVTDTAPGLQTVGATGLHVALSRTATAAPVLVSVDAWRSVRGPAAP